ncbi:nitroreductase family protein [Pelomonas cellulosilytica]|uniref:Nitroreductase family protein n=1 Tax=Pelomonas cellulosilytica TaxID=2906762 RepID=A0ABS8Y1B1_9BURK|nr:nitroreductase family protein [Pelomonas sp. P8]MCE4556799.1 nitroreductase family protein [Pelomonas sp. P8]
MPTDDLATVRSYHARSKHQLQRYAAGPETLDWDAQPSPWRRYDGAPLSALPLPELDGAPAWPALFSPGAVPSKPLDLRGLGQLLGLGLGLAAWKQQGPDRWAVRCNPSSGNLHPTEAWLLLRGMAPDPQSGGVLPDGLYHYAPRDHALERRASVTPGPAGLWLALTSIHWREAWKYGERAFRYCQLDAGHAAASLDYAAATLGWHWQPLPEAGERLAQRLGLDRDADRAHPRGLAEPEEPEGLFALVTTPGGMAMPAPQPLDDFVGRANRLDPHPMYRWPVIDAVANASRGSATAPPPWAPPASRLELLPERADPPSAAALMRQRRSAQRFDRTARMPLAAFARLCAALMPAVGVPPWTVAPGRPRVHPVLFAHRVDGLEPGAYVLPREHGAAARLVEALSPELLWKPVPLLASTGLPLQLLAPNPALAGTLRTLCCHQALGSDAMLAVALLAEFDAALASDGPHGYRQLLQECGLLGQVLYLEAEAAGLRGTGIGCFFDDGLHQLLGMADGDTRWQSLYHFTVGAPVVDDRISTEPPYAHRETP